MTQCVACLNRPARFLINHVTRLESEGGADSWGRPRLKHINQARDKIGAKAFPCVRTVGTNRAVSTVFQQVNIDGSYDNLQAGPQINVFGVTQVRLVRLVPFFPLICLRVKEGHSVLVHVTGFMPC